MAPRKRANCQICNLTESKYACPKCNIVYCSVTCYKKHKGASCAIVEVATSNEEKTIPPESVRNVSEDTFLDSNAPSLPSLLPEGSTSSTEEELGSFRETDAIVQPDEGPSLQEPKAPDRPLRKLSSLKWPYIPDMPSHPDPLTRDDPKPLNLTQYEAVATSPAVRNALASHNRLPDLLRSLDKLRGPERESALQRVLGVAPSQSSGFSLAGVSTSSESYEPNSSNSTHGNFPGRRRKHDNGSGSGLEVDKEDMRALRALAEAVEGAVRGKSSSTDLGLDWESMEL